MKTYKLKLNAAQPVRQTLPVPTNTYKYGVSVVTENIGTSNLSCSMTDGTSTIYGVKQPNDSFLLTLSSSSEENDRLVKFTLATGAKNIGGLRTEYTPDTSSAKIVTVDAVRIPAGRYNANDLSMVADAFRPSGFGSTTMSTYDDMLANLVGFKFIVIPKTGLMRFRTADNQILPEDAYVTILADTTFKFSVVIQPDQQTGVYISPDIFMGDSVASYHEVVLNETPFAVADGDIEDVPPTDIIVDSINAGGTTHDVEWKTITIDGVDCIVLAAKTTEE